MIESILLIVLNTWSGWGAYKTSLRARELGQTWWDRVGMMITYTSVAIVTWLSLDLMAGR